MVVKSIQAPKEIISQRPPKPWSHYVGVSLRYLVLTLIGFILFLPFILAALGTFKTDAEIIAFPPRLFPAEWLVENWTRVWNTDLGNGGTFPRWLLNTTFLSVTVASLEVIFLLHGSLCFCTHGISGPGCSI